MLKLTAQRQKLSNPRMLDTIMYVHPGLIPIKTVLLRLSINYCCFLLSVAFLNKVTFWLHFCTNKVTFSSLLGLKKSPY